MNYTFNGQPITASSPPSMVRNWAYGMAQKEYDEDKKCNIAADYAMEAHKYLQNLPIGCNYGDDPNLVSKRVYAHVRANVKPQNYGFIVAVPILSWFVWQILGGIISWAVKRILDLHYAKD